MSTAHEKLKGNPTAVNKLSLLCSVFHDVFLTLLSLFLGKASVQDVREEALALGTDDPSAQDDKSNGAPVSWPTNSHDDKSSTVNRESEAPGEPQDDEPWLATPEALRESSEALTGVRLLCRAIVQRDIEKVSRILESRPTLVSKEHEGGWHPLHAAVLTGDIEIVKKLFEYPRVDVNVQYEDKTFPLDEEKGRRFELGSNVGLNGTSLATPLHFAAMIGNIDIIRLLVERGADFKAKDEKNLKPIDYFSLEEHLEALEVFKGLYAEWKARKEYFRVYTDFDELAKLVWKDKYELFERAIKRNRKLASKTACTHVTLLHLAVILQRHRFVELLVSSKKSLVNKRDLRGHPRPFLHNPGVCCWLPEKTHLEQSKELPIVPPTVPVEYVWGATPLHYACLVKDMDIARMLLEAGASWTIKDSQGRIPEELIYEAGGGDGTRIAFVRLVEVEKERRKCMGEEYSKEDNVEEASDDASSGTDSNSDNDEGSTPAEKISMETLLELEDRIAEKLVGQHGPIHLVANAIRLRKGGWIDPDRPLTMLFLGSSGVGKTEVAKQIALYLHGKKGRARNDRKNVTDLEKDHSFVRLDMGEYQERHTVLNLIGNSTLSPMSAEQTLIDCRPLIEGSPGSYADYGDGGALTQPLKKNPRAVVLLDEIEKAHPDVLNTLLQVFNDGSITDSRDGVIHCKDAIFIMTSSSIAREEIREATPRLRESIAQCERAGRYESYVHVMQDFTRSLRPHLKSYLKRDEFIGRIDEMAVFLSLSQEEIELVVRRELAMWAERAREKHKFDLIWTDEVVHKLAAYYDVDYGVRSVTSDVQRITLGLVADAHIRGQISENCTVELNLGGVGDIVMKTLTPTGD